VVEKHVSLGAISDAGLLRGKVTVKDILPGEQLTATDFAPATGAASQLASDQRAVEIQLDASHGIGGVLQAGDHVDVYAGFNLVNLVPGAGGTGGSGVARPMIRLLNSNVPVLQASGGGANGNAGGGNITVLLAVNQNMAPQVAFAADNGKLWLVLRPGNGQNPTQPNTTIETILNGLPPIGDKSNTRGGK
jgi:Flp pilus assembly protein CpaB